MIKILHHDDGKEKFQSHELYMKEDGFFHSDEVEGLWSLNPFNVYGYGSSREEAFEDFKKKLEAVMKELQDQTCKIISIDSLDMLNDVVEVDCMGKPIDTK